MSLPYVRDLEYVSPSSLNEFERDPVGFYFKRLGPIESRPAREPQSFPAAVGTAFDAFVKTAVTEEEGIPSPLLNSMLDGVADNAIPMGFQLYLDYSKCGGYDQFLDLEPSSLEVETDAVVPGTEIPIFGYLDAQVSGKRAFDWKVTSSGRPGGMSPNKGYNACIDSRSGITRTHKLAGSCLETLNERWATQLTMYTWMLRGEIGPFGGCIDQIVVCPGYIRLAQFRAPVSVAFQHKVKQRILSMWTACQEERVVPCEMADLGYDTLGALLL